MHYCSCAWYCCSDCTSSGFFSHASMPWIVAAAAAFAPRLAWAKDPPARKGDVYAKDVEFLLDELGRKAADLLRETPISAV